MQEITLAKPAEYAENQIIAAILTGELPVNAHLPGERELATQIGVTRPTLREALQRLARDGWIEIRHGKATRVRDYWHEGNLGVLGAITRHSDQVPPEFISNLLNVRQAMAPAYTRQAVQNQAASIAAYLQSPPALEATPELYALFDWQLHHKLTILSGNPIFTLILNGFRDIYLPMAALYFALPNARQHSLNFYRRLCAAALAGDAASAQAIAQEVMDDSLKLWQAVGFTGSDQNPSGRA